MSNYRVWLDSVLRSDGATVANYQPGNYTGTLNASAWANSIGAAPSLAQATGGNQPIILPFSGQKYAYLPGVAGNYLSTPNAAANQITGDIDLRYIGVIPNWSGTGQFIAKWKAAGTKAYWFGLVSGVLQWYASVDGTTLSDSDKRSTSSVSFSNNTLGGVRVTKLASTGEIKFYTSIDSGLSWVQLGTTVAGSIFNIVNIAASVEIGSNGDGTGNLFAQSPRRAQIYNGINGNLAVDYNAADWPETSTNGATQASSTTGELWTLSNTGVKPAQIVGSPSLLFDGVAHYMAMIATLNQPTTWYAVLSLTQYNNGGDIYYMDGNGTAVDFVQRTGGTTIQQFAGGFGASAAGPTAKTFNVFTIGWSGASSFWGVNGGAANTGNAGTNNPGGLVVGGKSDKSPSGQMQAKEIIIRNVADSAATQAQIQALLKAIHGTP